MSPSTSAGSERSSASWLTQRSAPQTVRPLRPLACAIPDGAAAATATRESMTARRRRMSHLHRRPPTGSLRRELPVQDLLAALELERAVHAHPGRVPPRAAVDRAVAVVGPDEVAARARDDPGRAVAGVDEVVAGPADEDVALAAVVVGGVPVAPQDVVARAAFDAVAAMVAEQLVVGVAAGLVVVAAVEDLP